MTGLLPRQIEFTKMTAGGNDFVCIDNTRGEYVGLLASDAIGRFVSGLCRRGLSVGADGVIFACQRGAVDGVDIVARFMEPDGSEARLCGNGTACFAFWCVEKEIVAGPEVDILTAAGAAHACRNDDDPHRVRVCVPNPKGLMQDLNIEAAGRPWLVHLIDTGVPHAVTFVDDLADIDVAHWGAAIRHHSRFAAIGGVNANFTHIVEPGHIAVRTFEFGVEAETLACGTGSTAAAIISAIRSAWFSNLSGDKPVLVDVQGGEQLKIWFTVQDEHHVIDVCLEAGVRPVYEAALAPETIQAICGGL